MKTHFPHRSHDRVLLSINERFEHDSDGHINVIVDDMFTQVELSMRFCHSNHTFNVTNGNRNAPSSLRCNGMTYLKRKEIKSNQTLPLTLFGDRCTYAQSYLGRFDATLDVFFHERMWCIFAGDLEEFFRHRKDWYRSCRQDRFPPYKRISMHDNLMI